jgi:hypothetical protein
MKNASLLLLLLFGWLTSTWAKDITPQEAREAALKAVRRQALGFNGTVDSVEPVTYNGSIAYYVVRFVPQGWALISADDGTTPLLGYSTTGTFTLNNAPDNLQGWMNGYADQIVRVASMSNATRHSGWAELDQAPVTTRAAFDKVAPLITVHWNQSGYYKKYCPTNNSGQAIVGCVAVAMGQAMSVCRYPARPVGDHSYYAPDFGTQYINYDKEPAYNWNNILSGANNLDDVARLLWHCGVAVDMNYGISGSGAQSSAIATALQRNFSYPSSVTYYSRASYNGDWKMLIVNELHGGRAVCYSGHDPKGGYGHCFNLDGYDGNNMFHVNWGWGGTGDGYFPLDNLSDAQMGMDYTASQGVIVGIRPPSDRPSDIMLSETVVKEQQPAGTVVAEVTVSSEAVNPQYTYSVRGTYSPILHDYIKVPFTIEDGMLKTTEILKAADRQEWIIEITATNTANRASYSKTFTIYVMSSDEAEASPASGVTLKYEKETAKLIIASARHVTYTLYTAEENIIGEGELDNSQAEILLAAESTNACLLQLTTAAGSKTIRIILKKTEE